jgi:hypothetical protein
MLFRCDIQLCIRGEQSKGVMPWWPLRHECPMGIERRTLRPATSESSREGIDCR